MKRAVLIAFALAACESSATDWESQRRESQEISARNDEGRAHLREFAERERYAAAIDRAFAARFAGQVQPGVGCAVCPEMCRRADLRPMAPDELLRRYRDAAREHGYPADDMAHQLARLELKRLGCIARAGGEAARAAWMRLLAERERPEVRYCAAIQAVELGFGDAAARRALRELSRDSGKYGPRAAAVLDEWDLGIEPVL